MNRDCLETPTATRASTPRAVLALALVTGGALWSLAGAPPASASTGIAPGQSPVAATAPGQSPVAATAPIESPVAATAPIESPVAATAVRAVTDPNLAAAAQVAALPSDLAEGIDTSPGYPVRVDGGCSSLLPLPASFTDPCRAHDLGYDLLRYAQTRGRPLGSWARDAVDATFRRRLSKICAPHHGDERIRCLALTRVVTGAVRVNSWRQHSAAPVKESPWQMVLSWSTGGGRW